MKIDIYSHVIPPKIKDLIFKKGFARAGKPESITLDFPVPKAIESVPMMYDLELRFRMMDKYDGLMQVLTLGYPPIEDIADPAKAVDFAKLANDGLAELVAKYPDRFAAAVACLPMNDIDAALEEVDRAISELGLKGVQIYTPINDKPPDSPEFMPLYEKMAQYNLPIWLHPRRGPDYTDYRTVKESMYRIYCLFGWPYDTTVAMTHLVFSGVFDRLPNLKIITHHAGGMVPYFEQRIIGFYDKEEIILGERYMQGLTKAPIEYFKMFYNDTALYGHTSALTCAYTFSGADHLLFGTDMPLGDSQRGFRNTGQTIQAIEQMDIPDVDKKKIFEDNARQLLRLPI